VAVSISAGNQTDYDSTPEQENDFVDPGPTDDIGRGPTRPRGRESQRLRRSSLKGSVALTDRCHDNEAGSMKRSRRPRPPVSMPSGFVGFRFPPEVILLAVRWYLRYGLSYRDLEELLAERGIEVDHVTLYRWVQRFTPLLIEAARPCRHVVGDRWFVDETYVKVSGAWRYVYRAVDQHGQVIDVYVSQRRDIASARTFFTAALTVHGDPTEVITDRAPALANVIEELVPAALHNTGQYENNRVECDHGRLKARLRPMQG
jgi:IS6 family transposase